MPFRLVVEPGASGNHALSRCRLDPPRTCWLWVSAFAIFLDRINQIRTTTQSCDVSLPPAPDGLSLDLNKINVTFVLADGTKQPLTYDETCTQGTGRSWHFDNASAPTKISLCKMTCDVYEHQPTSKVTVEFGCQRIDVVVK